MVCKCASKRLVKVMAKSSDLNTFEFLETGKFVDGYVPGNLGIGRGDYIRFTYCLNCGQIQGNFPLDKTDEEGNEI